MRGLSYRPGKSWPRNPVPPDPARVRQRARSEAWPVTPNGMGR
jgi:hypothetical protein